MSSPNYFNNAISQLFDDIEQKCHVKFNTFTANDKPIRKGINADQEYMQMYQEKIIKLISTCTTQTLILISDFIKEWRESIMENVKNHGAH